VEQGQGKEEGNIDKGIRMNRDTTSARIMAGRQLVLPVLDNGTEGMKKACRDGHCVPFIIGGGVMPDVVEVGVLADPKGGGGIDHLAKVQQKRVQTDRHFPIPSPIPTFWFHCMESSNCGSLCLGSSYRCQNVRNTADFMISGVGSAFLQAPGVLTTRESDMDQL